MSRLDFSKNEYTRGYRRIVANKIVNRRYEALAGFPSYKKGRRYAAARDEAAKIAAEIDARKKAMGVRY